MDEAAEPRERIGPTLGIAVGLALVLASLAGLALGALRGGGTPLDAGEAVAAAFGEGGAPYGLEVADARRLASGRTVLRLVRPDASARDDADPETGAPAEPSGVGGSGPDELVLIEYASRSAARAAFLEDGGGGGQPGEGGESVTGHEASAKLAAWERDPSFAWRTTLDAGAISWSRWRADYRIQRAFREGGTSRDAARVDLCQEGRYLVLFALWPEEVAIDVDDLRDVLGHVRMRENGPAS